MSRRKGWEKALHDEIRRHAALPAQWAVSDCFIVACDVHEAITGQALLPELKDYRCEKSGYRLFRRFGFETVEQALASALESRSNANVQRGDLATVEQGGVVSCAVVTEAGLAVRTQLTPPFQFLRFCQARQFFKVG